MNSQNTNRERIEDNVVVERAHEGRRRVTPRRRNGRRTARSESRRDKMPFCTLNAAFAVATATFVGGAYAAHKSGADADSALGRWRRERREAEEAAARAASGKGKGKKK